MANSKLTTWWTALIGALVALLASLGLAGQATAAASVPQQAAAHNRGTSPAPETPNVRWALPGASALPPTMKQRIRAEAHGSSPSTRNLPGSHDGAEGADRPEASTPNDSAGAFAPDCEALPPSA